jgi:hypothetical protein
MPGGAGNTALPPSVGATYHFALGPMITRAYQERVKQPKKYPRTFGANSIGLGYWFKPNGKG